MNHWPFVIAAYAVTFAGAAVIAALSWWQMISAERRGK